ncbi:hypothetical protein [Providencia sp. CRPN22473]
MQGPNTQRVLRQLNEDGFKVRLTFIQDEMTIHISHKSGQLSKRQEEMVTQRIMGASLKDYIGHHNRWNKAQRKGRRAI